MLHGKGTVVKIKISDFLRHKTHNFKYDKKVNDFNIL